MLPGREEGPVTGTLPGGPAWDTSRLKSNPVKGECSLRRCPLASHLAGLTEDEDVRAMLRGSRLCKIRSQKWQKERLYRLQEDGLSVWFQRRIRHAPSQHICELGLVGIGGLDSAWAGTVPS